MFLFGTLNNKRKEKEVSEHQNLVGFFWAGEQQTFYWMVCTHQFFAVVIRWLKYMLHVLSSVSHSQGSIVLSPRQISGLSLSDSSLRVLLLGRLLHPLVTGRTPLPWENEIRYATCEGDRMVANEEGCEYYQVPEVEQLAEKPGVKLDIKRVYMCKWSA